jgi:hypothetical protein
MRDSGKVRTFRPIWMAMVPAAVLLHIKMKVRPQLAT